MYSVEHLTNNVINLTPEEQEQLFKIVTENAELLMKVLPGVPLINFILTGDAGTNHGQLMDTYVNWVKKQ